MSKRLTRTQKIILEAAASNDRGLVRFGPGDRRGTRVVRLDGLGVPMIIAYAMPEYFLRARGLLAPYGNERHTYQITDAGRAAYAKAGPA